MGLKGGISIDADSGPPRYVLWCCGGICHQVLTFFKIGCGHTVIKSSHLKGPDHLDLVVYFWQVFWFHEMKNQIFGEKFSCPSHGEPKKLPGLSGPLNQHSSKVSITYYFVWLRIFSISLEIWNDCREVMEDAFVLELRIICLFKRMGKGNTDIARFLNSTSV